MTLSEISVQYRTSAGLLSTRIQELQSSVDSSTDENRSKLQERIRTLSALRREVNELAVLTERYYDRGYRRNGKYTL